MHVDLSGMVVEVTHEFSAPVESVWSLLTDVERMAGLGPEHHAAVWVRARVDAESNAPVAPAVGDEFLGRNRRGDLEWEVPCHVIECEPPTRFAWTVLDPTHPSSTWSYTLSTRAPAGHSTITEVVQRFQHGPGRSFVRDMVERDPDRAEAIVQRRSEMLRSDMASTLAAADRILRRS